MISLIPLAFASTGVLVTGAAGLHGIQKAVAARADRRRQRAAARQAELDQQAAEDRARQQREAAERAQVSARRSRHPMHYISLQRQRINLEQAPFRSRITYLTARLRTLKQKLVDATPSVPAARQILAGVGVFFLIAAFVLSATQLIPSFRALAGKPSAVDDVLGVIVAAIEIGVALQLAHRLRPERGWKPLGAKLAAAMALAFAVVVVVAQIEWAPAHDTVPLNAMIAQAREQLAVDRQNAAPHLAIVTDQQAITNLTSQLSRATARDQGLALMVTLGADISAWPAVDGLLYMTAARRRRRLRPHIGRIEEEIATLERERDQIAIRITFETQQVLEELGLNPDLVLADQLPPDLPPPPLPLPLPPGSTNGPGGPGSQDEGARTTPPPPREPADTTRSGNGSEPLNGSRPGHQEAPGEGNMTGNGDRPVTVDDLFHTDADQTTDDPRWTDPF